MLLRCTQERFEKVLVHLMVTIVAMLAQSKAFFITAGTALDGRFRMVLLPVEAISSYRSVRASRYGRAARGVPINPSMKRVSGYPHSNQIALREFFSGVVR